jgi:prolyl oligopeptidase
MNQTIALMREGIAARILQPKIVMQRVPAQIARQITEKADDNPFFKPFTKFPKAIAEAEQDRLKNDARAAIKSSIEPAFREFQKFFSAEYLPACFDDVGAWQMPQGKECYAFLARRFTTTSMSPQQIHDVGMAEVKRIRSEMEKIKSDTGFKGSLPEFFNFLRTDPKFFYPSSSDLLAGYEATTRRIDPTLSRLFKTHPRARYKVQAIPANAAPDTTAAYYRQPAADGSRDGTYFVNLYKPEVRPKWEMMALSLHESVPGHHFQIALAQEQGTLPMFRRHMEFTAYVEGWALYCESLGDELGLYSDPYDKFGQLTYEMWRAVRLVVDTGIHEFHWSREKAIAFFKENAPKSELDITNEVDRYIGWPGQALAYKIGQMRIRELRTRSEKQLGDRFDLKAFHDVVLLGGSMPLEILEARLDDFINTNKTKP